MSDWARVSHISTLREIHNLCTVAISREMNKITFWKRILKADNVPEWIRFLRFFTFTTSSSNNLPNSVHPFKGPNGDSNNLASFEDRSFPEVDSESWNNSLYHWIKKRECFFYIMFTRQILKSCVLCEVLMDFAIEKVKLMMLTASNK